MDSGGWGCCRCSPPFWKLSCCRAMMRARAMRISIWSAAASKPVLRRVSSSGGPLFLRHPSPCPRGWMARDIGNSNTANVRADMMLQHLASRSFARVYPPIAVQHPLRHRPCNVVGLLAFIHPQPFAFSHCRQRWIHTIPGCGWQHVLVSGVGGNMVNLASIIANLLATV